MSDVTIPANIQEKIIALEKKRHEEGIVLKGQFLDLYERVKPANLIKGAIHDIVTPPGVKHHFLIQAMSITAGFLVKKYFQGKTNNQFQNLIGSVAMSGLSYVAMNNPTPLIMVGKRILTALFRKKNTRAILEPNKETA